MPLDIKGGQSFRICIYHRFYSLKTCLVSYGKHLLLFFYKITNTIFIFVIPTATTARDSSTAKLLRSKCRRWMYRNDLKTRIWIWNWNWNQFKIRNWFQTGSSPLHQMSIKEKAFILWWEWPQKSCSHSNPCTLCRINNNNIKTRVYYTPCDNWLLCGNGCKQTDEKQKASKWKLLSTGKNLREHPQIVYHNFSSF